MLVSLLGNKASAIKRKYAAKKIRAGIVVMANFSGRRCDLIESSFTGVQRYMALGLTLREKPQRLLALFLFFRDGRKFNKGHF